MSFDTLNHCPICNRHVTEAHNLDVPMLNAKPVSVYYAHDFYGCDTGCCGHALFVTFDNQQREYRAFEFTHIKETVENLHAH